MMNNIILVGLMGVGKSAIGKELAARLSMDFLDTDELIENNEGISISEIFEKYGEAHFRQLEADLIRNIKVRNTVISVGGGLPVHDSNMEKLAELGTRIYLQISEDKLASRLWVVRKKRPLLKDIKTLPDLESYLENQLKSREKYYFKADFVLNVNDKASCEIVEELSNIVKNLK